MPPLGPCGVRATMHAPPPSLLVGMRCWQLTAADCCGCCWLLLLGCAVGCYPGAMQEGTKCATAQHLQHYKTKLNGGCAPYQLPAATLQQHRAVCRPLFELRARASSPWDGCVPWVCRITQELQQHPPALQQPQPLPSPSCWKPRSPACALANTGHHCQLQLLYTA